MPITWRNVQNTVTGNPAAALSGAVSAFGTAGAGASKLLEQAVDRKERDTAERSDDALQKIFGKGELAGVDTGANFSEVLSAYDTRQVNDANIEQSQASTRRNNLLSEDLEFEASPDQRARKRSREDAADALDQTRAGTAATNAQTAATNAKRVTDLYEQEAADVKLEKDINTEWDLVMAEKSEPYNTRASEEIARITNAPETEIPFAEKQRLIGEVERDHGAALEELRRNTALGFTSTYKMQNPGVTGRGLDNSRPFALTAELASDGKARSDARLKNELEIQQKQASATGDLLAGGKNKLPAMGIAGGKPYALSKDEAKANKITAARAKQDIKDKAGTKWFVDDVMPARYQKHIEAIVEAVGGNKQLYNSVMSDVDYNRDTAFLGLIGGEDDVTGLPKVTDVEDIVKAHLDELNRLHVGAKPDKVQTATDRLFNR